MSTKRFTNTTSQNKKIFKKLFSIALILSVMLVTTSCSKMLWPWSELWEDKKGSSSGENYSPTIPAIEASETYAIALGGVAPGRDELILTDLDGDILDLEGRTLEFEIDDTTVIGLMPRPDYDDFVSGSGAQIIPQNVGFAVISYYIDGDLQADQFLVIVPPQSLIQMMVAEASSILTQEAEIDANSHVKLDSDSKTADGIGAVTRNRVDTIRNTFNYSLFNVSEIDWLLNPPESHYDAVIKAEKSGVYQYSPVDPGDPTNDVFEDAQDRNFLDASYHRAYDQAVLSAAYIYSTGTEDPTNGAFGFFSPTDDEYECIENAYDMNMILLPSYCGVSDDDFPSLSPIQILVLPGVWKHPVTSVPSFVFIRQRDAMDYVVVKTP